MSGEQAAHRSHGKTQLVVFAFENEQIAEIRFLTGNDLETSEVLYFSLFCIIPKERFHNAKLDF